MRRSIRERNEAIRLPIADVDFALRAFKEPRTTMLIHGARRQVVDKVVQMLETAKRNQIDGLIELDVKDIGLLLQSVALTVERMADIFHDWFDDDEQI
jgi:hypothetical protein